MSVLLQDIDPIDFAFPMGIVGKYLPNWEDLPEDFRKNWCHNKWCELAARWFYQGAKGWTFYPKEGIERSKALKQVSMCLRSFEPRHEHKIAGCGYLLSEFFERIDTP